MSLLNTSDQYVEIERKFLVESGDLPNNLEQYPRKPILQGYIVSDGDTGVRLRLKGDDCYITVKSGQGMARAEHEGLIPRETFDALWPTTEGRRVEKIRYEIPAADGLLFELDIYGGELRGLITVEAEFESIETAERFVPPQWFGRDVTEDNRYTNSQLAIDGLPE